METVNTYIQNRINKEKELVVVDYDRRTGYVELCSKKFGHISKQGIDLLDSFTQIREVIENENYLIFLTGSRIDVMASGGLRDSTNGISTYLLPERLDEEKQVLNIFSFSENNIGTMDEQAAFYQDWRRRYKEYKSKQ